MVMVRDYSERRQIRKIHPKSRPAVWPYILVILFFISIAFSAGFGTGWYLYRPGGKFYKAPVAAAAPSPKNTGNLPPQGEPLTLNQPYSPGAAGQQPAQASPVQEKGSAAPPLTFYNTLQKGGSKELMGTGINNPKEGQGGTPKPASSPQIPER